MVIGKGVLLAILTSLLVLSLSLSVFLLSANIFLYPDVYVDSVEGGEIQDLISSDIPGGGVLEISEEKFESLFKELLDNFLSYFRGESEEVDPVITINNTVVQDIVEEQAEELPLCGEGEDIYNTEGMVRCRPSGVDVSEFVDDILEENEVTIPEEDLEVDLGEVYGIEDEDFEQVRDYVKTYKNVKYGILILSLLLIGLIFFISKDIKLSLKWIGIGFLASGAVIVVIGKLIPGIVLGFASSEIELIANLIVDLIAALVSREMFYGYILLGVGAVAFGVYFFLMKQKGKKK